MSAPRVLVPALAAPGGVVALPDEERRHARSRRLFDGDAVVLLDGRGARALGTLVEGASAVRVESETPPAGEPRRRVTVLLGAAEPSRVEWAVEKGTECGAAEFRLAACERSQESHVRALAARAPRLARIAAEAVKQCDRTCVPRVAAPRPLGEVVASLELPIWLARPGAPRPTRPPPDAFALVIGPEGGFSDVENELFDRVGAFAFGLGARTLRLETATVVALSFLVDLP